MNRDQLHESHKPYKLKQLGIYSQKKNLATEEKDWFCLDLYTQLNANNVPAGIITILTISIDYFDIHD
jgi:hypothetical protein